MIRNLDNIKFPIAAYDIPAFSLVGVRSDEKIILADNGSIPAIGIVDRDYASGDAVVIMDSGEINNGNWSFEKDLINTSVFLSTNGSLSSVSRSYIIQKIGTIIGKSKILISINDYLILNPTPTPSSVILPTPTPTGL